MLLAEGTACAKARRWKRTGRAFGPKMKQRSGEPEDKANQASWRRGHGDWGRAIRNELGPGSWGWGQVMGSIAKAGWGSLGACQI